MTTANSKSSLVLAKPTIKPNVTNLSTNVNAVFKLLDASTHNSERIKLNNKK